jgi:Xaa-Pro aminopeptidase
MSDKDLAIPVSEYAKRREKVLRALDGATGLVSAGNGASAVDLPGSPRQTDSHFWYLTGLGQETGAAVLFDPTAEDADRKITLFLRPRDPEAERWNGVRAPLDSGLRAKTGFSHIARTPSLPARLTDAARRTRRLACLHPFASYEADLSPDLALFKKVCERVPTVTLEDRTQVLPAMRAVKSPAELALMEKAVAITTAGYTAALRSIRPGANESDIAHTMTAAFRELGGTAAFEPIVGSGANGTVLHYSANDQVVSEGDLIVIDYAAGFGGYAADVTRTLPASGRFTPEQRRLYEIVLRANFAATLAAVPGATFADLQKAARAVIAKAGHEDDFLHGVGHHLGIEVHDVTPDGPLAPGMVLTIEPGIYLADKGIGIRIEDDVLITKSGPKVLTTAIPKTVEAIEAAMAGR